MIPPSRVRRSLHASHAVLTLLLGGTGLLLAFPELRSAVTGGYGGLLLDLHLWAGVLFAAAPILALALSARPLADDLRRRFAPPSPGAWRRAHLALSLVSAAGLSLSGAALAFDARLPTAAADLARLSHEAFTVLVLAALPVHLVAARGAIAERVRRALGLAPPVDAFFDFDDPER